MAMVAPLAADAAAGGAATAEGAAEGSSVLRPNAYKGGSSMAVDGHNRPPKAAKPEPVKRAAPPKRAETPEEPQETPEEPQERRGRRGLPRLPNPSGTVREGSWIVLGFLGWVWVALPFIKSGPGGVRDVLAAKFLNRTADAHELHVQNKGAGK